MKIRSKILLPIYILIIIGFSFIGTGIYFIVYENNIQNAFDHLETRTLLKTNDVDNFLEELTEKLEELTESAQSKEHISMLSKYQLNTNHPDYKNALNELQKSVIHFKEIHPEIRDIIFADSFGIVLFSLEGDTGFVENIYGKGFLERSKSGIFISDIRLKDLKHKTSSYIFASSPIYNKDEFLGIISIELDTKPLDFILLSTKGLGKTGKTYLVGRDGIIRTQVNDGYSIKFHQKISSPAFTGCFQNNDGMVEDSYENFLGKQVIGQYHYINDIDMCLITEIALSEILATSQRILLLLIIACGITFIGISLIILKFIKNITSPLIYLTEKIQEVGKGNKDITLDISSGDEVGDLASNFQEMVGELKKVDKKIQKKVHEQTHEIQAQQKETEKLNKDLLKFQEALKKASDYIAIFDNECRIVYINTSLEKETGYSLSKCIGGEATDFWRQKEDKKRLKKVWKNIQDTKESTIVEMITNRKDGTSFVSDVHISPILNPEGKIIFFLTIENDITQEKQVKKMKDEFISLVSHELRTPMTVIGGFTKLFLEEKFGSINPEQKKYLERIDSNIKYLIHMVNDMLDIEKLNSGKIEFHYEKFNVYTLLKNLQLELSLMCEEKNIKLSLSGKNQKIISDKEKIQEVITNLIRNAYKFTEKGGSISIKLSSIKKSHIKIEITDTGIGIKEEDFGKVFQKFGQVDSQLQKKHEGTGLGLSICKLIVEKLGGEIHFTSTYSEGSTFYFTIPITQETT